jgi:AbrB family looped-hinge helix DNA binding protein
VPIATVTSKGQITLPQAVRRGLGLEAGDKIDFVPDHSGGYRVVAHRNNVTVLRGSFSGRVTRPASVEEMAEAVEMEAASRFTATDKLLAAQPARHRKRVK